MNTETLEMYRRPDSIVLPELVSLGYFVTSESRLGGVRQDGTGGLEIGYLEQGSVEWWDGKELHEAGPNSVLIDHPGDWQGGVSAIVHPCTRYWLRFDFPHDESLPGLAASTTMLLRDAYNSMGRRHFPGRPALRELFNELLVQQRDPGAFAEDLSRALFHQIMIGVLGDYERQQARKNSPVVVNALSYMKANLASDIRVDAVSNHVSLSTGYFHDIFLRETGFTPARYHMYLRIIAAKHALIDTQRSITDIGFELGFSSSQYFATSFKKLVGLTPNGYRQLRRADL
ncbi:AraC family transcriptional regulator [Devosia algicola]|uniref:AraC family transcriptional regulator n=1 Tax=Devosia algicola TaxID=3026418 RepID=A0ABY7YM69_9HYPH|nr:AraC family transcriptional regulator [Devosia algicola]WDR02358.1 AraC family transcriptional regulator [Devosia algicola]